MASIKTAQGNAAIAAELPTPGESLEAGLPPSLRSNIVDLIPHAATELPFERAAPQQQRSAAIAAQTQRSELSAAELIDRYAKVVEGILTGNQKAEETAAAVQLLRHDVESLPPNVRANLRERLAEYKADA